MTTHVYQLNINFMSLRNSISLWKFTMVVAYYAVVWGFTFIKMIEVKYSNQIETHFTPIHTNPPKELTKNWSEIFTWSKFANQSEFTSGLM